MRRFHPFLILLFIFTARAYSFGIYSSENGCETTLDTGERHQMNPDALRAYYAGVREIITFMRQTLRRFGFDLGQFERDVDSGYHRVAANGGVSLVLSYGMPETIETPLGGWQVAYISGTNRADYFAARENVMRVLTEKFGLEKIMAEEDVSGPVGGPFGPVYRLTRKVDGGLLPEVFRLPEDNVGGLVMHSYYNSINLDWDADDALWERVRPRR